MITNYLKIALRNLIKHKLFSIINIGGMAISLASCLLISLFVWDELQYDRHHPDGERTYRVYNITSREGVEGYLPIVPYPFASYMQKDFPEIESTLRILSTYGEELFEVGDKKIMESDGLIAEPSFFNMLTVSVIEGNAESALVKPDQVALSATLAQKYFGDKSPLGETIKIDGKLWNVSAVFTDVPSHFHLKVNYVISFSSTNWSTRFENNWQRQQIFTYLKLMPGTDADALEAKFKPFVEKYAYPTIKEKGITYVPYLQNIKDIHLTSSKFEWEIAQRGDAQTVYILMVTSIMIVIIACLNFINLSTSRSIKRMKEVGVRKVAGANRGQLILQFISESILITLLGLILATVLAELALPYLNTIIERQLVLPFQAVFITGAILFCLSLGALAGCYPAFYLSGFRPAHALTKQSDGGGGSTLFRKSLVVLQFMFAFLLITGSWIVSSQNELIKTKNLGFDKEQIVVIPLRNPQLNKQETTKAKYKEHPNVVRVTIGFGLPGDIIAGDDVTNPVTKVNLPTSLFCVDFDYIKTMDIKVIAGRDFSTEHATDSSEAFIVNETAARNFGLGTPEEAIGKSLDWDRWDNGKVKHGRVIGVVQDFHFKSLREKLTPVVIHIYPKASWKLAARIKPENVAETIAHFKKTYESLDPEWTFSYSFLDQNFDAMYKSEQRLGKLFSIFTYLAIVVACLGLFGLVEYSVNQRTKEISIRKVFGASMYSLLLLLTRKYFLLVLIAFVVIIPLSYYAAQQWLSNFAYHITLGPWLYAKACGLILLITAFTVSFQSARAVWTNPADSLRNE